jgi:hypothetical protein
MSAILSKSRSAGSMTPWCDPADPSSLSTRTTGLSKMDLCRPRIFAFVAAFSGSPASSSTAVPSMRRDARDARRMH